MSGLGVGSATDAGSAQWDALWTGAEALGRWAWLQRRSYLPREAWHQLREKLPATPVGPAARVEITRQATGDTMWRKLWGGAPRQRLLRKMFELASAPELTVRDLAHLAFNAGQIEAGGAVDKLRRLAGTDPSLGALRNLADIYDTLRMGTLRAYVKPESLAGTVALTGSDFGAIMDAVRAEEFPPLPVDRHWSGNRVTIILAVTVVLLIVIAYCAAKLVAENPVMASVVVAISALVGGGAVYWTHRRGIK